MGYKVHILAAIKTYHSITSFAFLLVFFCHNSAHHTITAMDHFSLSSLSSMLLSFCIPSPLFLLLPAGSLMTFSHDAF